MSTKFPDLWMKTSRRACQIEPSRYPNSKMVFKDRNKRTRTRMSTANPTVECTIMCLKSKCESRYQRKFKVCINYHKY